MMRNLLFLLTVIMASPLLAFDNIIHGSLTVTGADLRLGVNDGRWQGNRTHSLDGRALVHGWLHDELIINFDQDFEGGVRVMGDFFVQDGWWGGHQLRVVLNNPGIEIGSSTGRLNFWHTNHGYTDLYTRNVTARDGGSMYARGFVIESDLRLKYNLRPIRNALDSVLQLRGVEYNLISDPDRIDQLGFIAQEVELVLPQLVYPIPDTEDKGLNYQGFLPVLVEAIKQQQLLLEQQAARITALEQLLEN